jgi:hypothetical protein
MKSDYNSNNFRKFLQENNIHAVIPGKKSRLVSIEYGTHIYKERNIIERFFNQIK